MATDPLPARYQAVQMMDYDQAIPIHFWSITKKPSTSTATPSRLTRAEGFEAWLWLWLHNLASQVSEEEEGPGGPAGCTWWSVSTWVTTE
ncbi:hypothetical protein THAOC_10027 [Thalassiosira oceanica]|uniref:Uncharacterized protein n=1 Tax=Thalassiosira oceanica TaxID=159749 RepID=K0SV03_THAOC|nr:hypothetical protein THAOC_10027 [Thalassiosira oceanica]|eukprot:EJK68764.1 hypothetical protein THAOC_10027 [Thalassiosira oceanica]